MNGARAKSIKKYVRDNWPMLSKETLYTRRPNGTIEVHPSCIRGVYRQIKKNYKRRHTNA